MGRRSVNTTKSGKYMNPTDQARKEARKKELRKNKKQRMAVRQAVLKAKDALQLLEEATMYDKQEYDPNVQAALNERVLQEKRKRLLDTYDRLILLYRKEDPEYATQLQNARIEYDKRRHEMMLFYEQVKLAERVKASEIPLPDLPPSQIGLVAPDTLFLPTMPIALTKGILKKPIGPGPATINRKPPGPPPLPVPELSDSDSEETSDPRQKKIRFADGSLGVHENSVGGFPASQIPLPVGLPNFPGITRPGFSNTVSQSRIIMHNPGGAVLSAPPTLNPMLSGIESSASLDSLNEHQSGKFLSTVGGTTIEAKPQLKNLIGDATRFIPTAVKVRRTVKDARGRLVSFGGGVPSSGANSSGKRSESISGRSETTTMGGAANKDVAYDEFMREMEGLL